MCSCCVGAAGRRVAVACCWYSRPVPSVGDPTRPSSSTPCVCLHNNTNNCLTVFMQSLIGLLTR